MAKNYMAEIAKMLGVELGEEFQIRDVSKGKLVHDYLGKITETKFLVKNGDDSWFQDGDYFLYFLNGELEVVPKPYEPKMNEIYYTYADAWEPTAITWTGNAWDYINKACDMVFRTKEELIAARPQQYRKLTGKEWEETNNG